jgi:hypothetical protein
LLLALVDFLYFGQQLFGGEQVLLAVGGPNVQVTDHAHFIDDDIGALGEAPLLIKDAEGRHRFAVAVAEKGIIDLGEVGKGLLRERRVGADPENLGILGLKLVILVRTGRLQIFDSCGAEIKNVEVDEDVFSLEAAELEFPSLAAVELEVGRLFSDLKGGCAQSRGQNEEKSEQQVRGNPFYSFHGTAPCLFRREITVGASKCEILSLYR